VRKTTPIFFRYVWANEDSGFREFATGWHAKEPFKDLAKLYAFARELGWRTCNPHNDIKDGYCELDYQGYYQISPEGDIFLCSHTFDKQDAIGSVLRVLEGQPAIRDDAVPKYLKWYSANPLADAECLSCNLLPVCSGGCRLARVEGTRSCIEEKSSLDLYVRSVVNERIGQQKHYGVQDLLSFKEKEVECER
jgi:radical SAM protein with 4Fe4S-binding SPASM domain